jgi:PAS domain S-box-containing protein
VIGVPVAVRLTLRRWSERFIGHLTGRGPRPGAARPIIGTAEPITVSREDDVSSPDQLLARILDEVPQPVWVVDQDGRIVFANPASVAALGYDDAAHLHGRASHDTVHYNRIDGSAYPAEECPMLRPRLTGATVHSDDEWFVRRDGTMFPIAWWSAPIDLPGGRGAVLAFSDITERRRGEHAMRERDAAQIKAAEARAAHRRMIDHEVVVRHRVARDLHDGAQQRLVTLLIALQLADEELAAGSGQAAAFLAKARQQAQEAIDELRDLAAGIHPAVLTSRGLAAAVEALAQRAVVPVLVSASLDRPVPAATEAHAYFFVAEAITNVVKHARASHARITIRTDPATLVVVVSDDGVGGAVMTGGGSGLTGLADRLAAIDSTLAVASPAGQGTTLRAVIPLPDEV